MLDAAGANVVKHRKKGVCRGRAARNARRQAVFAGDSEGEKTEATYMIRKITDSVLYIGADDRTIDLFEGQYVVPEGMSYNSYLVKGTQCAVLDAVDKRAGPSGWTIWRGRLKAERRIILLFCIWSRIIPEAPGCCSRGIRT